MLRMVPPTGHQFFSALKLILSAVSGCLGARAAEGGVPGGRRGAAGDTELSAGAGEGAGREVPGERRAAPALPRHGGGDSRGPQAGAGLEPRNRIRF